MTLISPTCWTFWHAGTYPATLRFLSALPTLVLHFRLFIASFDLARQQHNLTLAQEPLRRCTVFLPSSSVRSVTQTSIGLSCPLNLGSPHGGAHSRAREALQPKLNLPDQTRVSWNLIQATSFRGISSKPGWMTSFLAIQAGPTRRR